MEGDLTCLGWARKATWTRWWLGGVPKELFMFPRLAFPKTLEKNSRIVKCMVKGLVHLNSEVNSEWSVSPSIK